MLDEWYLHNIVCPRDHQQVSLRNGALSCNAGHCYPIVDDVPVMLLDDVPPTMEITGQSLRRANGQSAGDGRAPELYLETLSISEEEKSGIVELARANGTVDAVVAYLVAATNGRMYKHLLGRLARYPIPQIPMANGNGEWVLDVGCSWGRWSIAAAVKGYQTVGIDPSLGAVMAARRVARQLGLPNRYLVADARHLPFASASFGRVYSYSVVQHLSRIDAAAAVTEMGRVLEPGGTATVQMPNRFGISCLVHQVRRAFREAVDFEVRYWTLPQLRRLFTQGVGHTRFKVDCFFGIGLQSSDVALMPAKLKIVLRASEGLKTASRVLPGLTWVADSVLAESVKNKS
jgi:SAM-dependent methyltransferase/uncharacterized protein YbaR (Trm112 family)